MRNICLSGSQDCFSLPLREFIDGYPSQVALLGIQMRWTSKVQECLERSPRERLAEFNKGRDYVFSMMNELTAMCLEDFESKLLRTKIETLVTIHVHQRDLF